MRPWPAALGVACALTWGIGRADAQLATPGVGAGAGTAAMPGQVVSTGFNLNPAGAMIPKAVPQAGTPIGSPLTRPYDPSKPLDVFKGTNIDPNSVVSPVSGFPSIPSQQPDLLERVYDKLSSVTAFFRPTYPTAPPRSFTPGIFRRNKERANRMWRAD